MQVFYVALGTGEDVVGTEHIMTACQEPVAQVRTEDVCAAGDQDPFSGFVMAPGSGFLIQWQKSALAGRRVIASKLPPTGGHSIVTWVAVT